MAVQDKQSTGPTRIAENLSKNRRTQSLTVARLAKDIDLLFVTIDVADNRLPTSRISGTRLTGL